MKIDIKENHYQIVTEILMKYLDSGDKIYAFGSRVKGSAQKFSDLDLVIESVKSRIPLKESLTESSSSYFVDILNYNKIPDFMKEEIDSHKILFLEKRSD